MFQSLRGVSGRWGRSTYLVLNQRNDWFQSLRGVSGRWGVRVPELYGNDYDVSIPERG